MLVTITLLHSRLYDEDNAYSSVKLLLDCDGAAGVPPQRRPRAHLELEVEQQKIRANETWISIREAA